MKMKVGYRTRFSKRGRKSKNVHPRSYLQHQNVGLDDNLFVYMRKALLLRKIQAATLKGSVSENVLGLLELVRSLDFGLGKDASKSMKMAYCAVAVDCIVRFLDEEPEKSRYFHQAMKRIWEVRVRKIVRSEDTSLISGELLLSRDNLKYAVRDREVCDRILSNNMRYNSLKAVKVYLAEAWKDLGISFMDKIATQVGISQGDGEDSVVVEDPGFPVDEGGDPNDSEDLENSVTQEVVETGDDRREEHVSECPGSVRRRTRRWSSMEVDALREGVMKFGRGKWTLIRQAYHEVLHNRTEVDLKDKWGNLTK